MNDDNDPMASTMAAGQTGLAGTLAAASSARGSARSSAPAGIDRYVVGRELGHGGMGAVFLAEDRQFSRDVAIKRLRRDVDRELLEDRFIAESLITGNLEHPGIPPVYERGESGNGLFYVMRRVKGQTLKEALDEAQTLDQRLDLVPALVRVAETLAYAHSQGVVHRDIKPSNIVLGHYGESYVLDWGIAKVRGTSTEELASPVIDSSPNATSPGAVMGTPAYMAPEQAAGRIDAIDERTDVFALGTLLYHVLTGQPPYDDVDTLSRAKAGDFKPVDRIAPSTPRVLRQICTRAMSRRPEDRYSSAGEVASALSTFTSRAVANEDRGAVGWCATAATAAMATLALFSVAAVILTTSQSDPGYPALIADTLCALGIALSVIQYSTRGAYQLGPLILAVAGATFLVGILAVTLGTDAFLELASTSAASGDAHDHRSVVTMGTRKVVQAFSIAVSLTFVQLIAWAWAERRVLAG